MIPEKGQIYACRLLGELMLFKATEITGDVVIGIPMASEEPNWIKEAWMFSIERTFTHVPVKDLPLYIHMRVKYPEFQRSLNEIR
jgi:hypothetical protein